MNYVQLKDFDMETLSEVANTLKTKIDIMDEPKYRHTASIQKRRDRLMVFRTQVLFAFSIVKERRMLSIT